MTASRGTVISVHRLGATVRLDDGKAGRHTLRGDVRASGRLRCESERRESLSLEVETRGRHRLAFLARPERAAVEAAPAPVVSVHDSPFEEQMRRYLKETEEWAPPDRPHPAERHFIRKKRRAAHFEGRARYASAPPRDHLARFQQHALARRSRRRREARAARKRIHRDAAERGRRRRRRTVRGRPAAYARCDRAVRRAGPRARRCAGLHRDQRVAARQGRGRVRTCGRVVDRRRVACYRGPRRSDQFVRRCDVW